MKEGGIVRRLFDVSVSILMAAVLLVSQTWAVTAAYADYSINGFASSNDSVLDSSAATQDGLVSEEQNWMVLPRILSPKTCS